MDDMCLFGSWEVKVAGCWLCFGNQAPSQTPWREQVHEAMWEGVCRVGAHLKVSYTGITIGILTRF